MDRPRLLLADSHALMLEGLQTFLEPRFEIVGATDNFESLLKCVSKLARRCNFGYFDSSGQPGALRRLRDLYKNVRIVLLSFYGDVTVVRESLALGVSGYVLKWALTSDLVSRLKKSWWVVSTFHPRSDIQDEIDFQTNPLSRRPSRDQDFKSEGFLPEFLIKEGGKTDA
jgi:DNA-binding NarL/FixJ family response regulator